MVMMLYLWRGVVGEREQVDDACMHLGPGFEGYVIIIWNKMQSLMLVCFVMGEPFIGNYI